MHQFKVFSAIFISIRNISRRSQRKQNSERKVDFCREKESPRISLDFCKDLIT